MKLVYVEKVEDVWDGEEIFPGGEYRFYFHSHPDKARGDDWNDAPFDCNAGTPYTALIYHYIDGNSRLDPREWNEDKTPKYTVWEVRVPIDQIHERWKWVCDDTLNVPYSVDSMNRGEAAWFLPLKWEQGEVHGSSNFGVFKHPPIISGVDVFDFCGFLMKEGITWTRCMFGPTPDDVKDMGWHEPKG